MRSYRLGKRRASVDRTRDSILSAARELVSSGHEPTVAAVARKAGVSRITVYNRFGSRDRLVAGLAPSEGASTLPAGADARESLRRTLLQVCVRWAENPSLYRHLPAAPDPIQAARDLAQRLAQDDVLRAGCSIKEAEDVIQALASFPLFDRLHHDGRRSPTAVADIMYRLAGGILA